jgi:hypothetical protein
VQAQAVKEEDAVIGEDGECYEVSQRPRRSVVTCFPRLAPHPFYTSPLPFLVEDHHKTAQLCALAKKMEYSSYVLGDTTVYGEINHIKSQAMKESFGLQIVRVYCYRYCTVGFF